MTSRTFGLIAAGSLVFVLLGSCPVAWAQAEAPTPPGPTPEEVTNFALAQAQYRSVRTSGNEDLIIEADNTLVRIPREILYRQDPRLSVAWAASERRRTVEPPVRGRVRLAFESPFQAACEDIAPRYNAAALAIRRDLEARTAAGDMAIIGQAIGTQTPRAGRVP
jgi:hypothetical protein